MGRCKYTGVKRREISFPLGGIGTGCLGLDGTGRLRDWEIFNRPNKGSINGFSHFGVKVEREGEKPDARVLNADLLPPYATNTGFGPSRYLMSGFPHFRDSVFTGEFPFASVDFIDDTFPGRVRLCAFNPFIPGDADASSIPAAFFTVEIENTSGILATYTAELSVNNPAKKTRINELLDDGVIKGVDLRDGETCACDPGYGSVAFAAPSAERVTVQQYWYRGSWFDNVGVFWQDLSAPGALKNRVYGNETGYSYSVHEDVGTVEARLALAPGESARFRFVIAWYYPNCENYWSGKPCCTEDSPCSCSGGWKNEYASRFKSAAEVARYAILNWDSLEARTCTFRDALYSSTLPGEALEALSANLAVLKSPTCLRLENGEFYAFEGCHADCGCCDGSCTHVWNYAFALPFLFPKLERSMRELDYAYNMRDDGGMPFRLQLPLGSKRSAFRPCVDGQMGGVIKSYREWKISGDDKWLAKWWPYIKRSLEFAWSETNEDRWDPDKSGVITGRQHHTLDMELFGPNAWLNSFYTGALKAASEMARAMGEDEDAAIYDAMYKRGREYTDSELFNGDYYYQQIDLKDREQLYAYKSGGTLTGGEAADAYWSREAEQVKYQIGDGCGVDQVLAQWMCALSGVGEILNPSHVKRALSAIYRNNFKQSVRDHANPCRIYALNDESGLIICSWPEGARKPVVPIPYAEEAMNGFEYQAACHMIMNGLEAEGLRVVRGVRDRYDGENRNPWNEFECGSNYARSMASYALLIAYSGFRFDMTRRAIGFSPLYGEGRFFWSLDGAWGVFELDDMRASLSVLEGAQPVLLLHIPGAERVRALALGEHKLAFKVEGDALALETEVAVKPGTPLTAYFG